MEPLEIIFDSEEGKEYYSKEFIDQFLDWLWEEPRFTEWSEGKKLNNHLFNEFLEKKKTE